MLTPVAIAEGMAVANTLFNNKPTKPNYQNVATAIFSTPSCATVGLTEQEAREQSYAVDIFRTSFKPLKHTLTGRDERTMMKLVVDQKTDKVLGCHMVGPNAEEIIQGLAIALNCGATKAQFDATIGVHPSAAEEFVTMRTKVVLIDDAFRFCLCFNSPGLSWRICHKFVSQFVAARFAMHSRSSDFA